MKFSAKCVAWLLPLLLAGCLHRPHRARNRQLTPLLIEPALKPTPVELSASSAVIPLEPLKVAPTPAVESRRPRSRRRRRTGENAEEAVNPAPAVTPEVSALGQLSSGDPATDRNQTLKSIDSIERSLNEITRELTASDQKIAGQIREYLKEARSAVAGGDMDGAHTLAVKARVLLAELTK